MQDPPEAEARAWLAGFLVCDDPGEWVHQRLPKGLVSLSCGLVDSDGVGTGLLLELLFRRSVKTDIEKFVFSVFKLTPHGRLRTYQLDIEKFKSPPKNLHSMPHEHFGDKRIIGTSDWFNWSYEEILYRFCSQTGVKFLPAPPQGPEVFELKG